MENNPCTETCVKLIVKQHSNSREFPGFAQTLSALGIDSLNRVEMVMKIEHDFGISIPDSDISADTTVQNLIEIVETLR